LNVLNGAIAGVYEKKQERKDAKEEAATQVVVVAKCLTAHAFLRVLGFSFASLAFNCF
jgi:hypothetical protein